jgi:vacuolar protein sorting-associated protein 13A/C
VYLSEFQRLHFILDSARKAAADSATQMQATAGLFKFDIDIQTPIIVFPETSLTIPDSITMNLGKIMASNTFKMEDGVSYGSEESIISSIMTARLSSMKLYSQLSEDDLEIIDILHDVSVECSMNRFNLNNEVLTTKSTLNIPDSFVSNLV